jgi:hypothetical protein
MRRVACYRQIHFRQVRGPGHPVVREDLEGEGACEPMVRGGVAELPPRDRKHRRPVGVQPVEGTGDRREARGRADGEAGEGAGRVRSAVVEEQVLGRRFLQHGRSVAPAVHTFPSERCQERRMRDLQEARQRVVGGHLLSSCLEEGS